MAIEDWFGSAASSYASCRPTYPDTLFVELAKIAPRGVVWDCACGSGQASVGLAAHFDRVIATDASPRQVAAASATDRVEYRVATADASGLDDASCAAVTVAQALHWFAGPAFYREAQRVLRPGGLLAAWSYGLCRVDSAVDRWVRFLFDDVVGDYWPQERRHVDDGYAAFALPGEPLTLPSVAMTARWRVEQMLGYLRTWSAVGRCYKATGVDPVDTVAADIRKAWPADSAVVEWPLVVLAAQKV